MDVTNPWLLLCIIIPECRNLNGYNVQGFLQGMLHWGSVIKWRERINVLSNHWQSKQNKRTIANNPNANNSHRITQQCYVTSYDTSNGNSNHPLAHHLQSIKDFILLHLPHIPTQCQAEADTRALSFQPNNIAPSISTSV